MGIRKASASALFIYFAATFLGALPAAAARVTPVHVPIVTDARVELVSIVWRLAGAPEYSKGWPSPYSTAVREAFKDAASHPAVVEARRLHDKEDISFDAPMKFAMHLVGDPAAGEQMVLGSDLSELLSRWRPDEARAFVGLLNRFAADTGFARFRQQWRPWLESTAAAVAAGLDADASLAWLQDALGPLPDAAMRIVVAPLNGQLNYSTSARGADGVLECSMVLGVTEFDANGSPRKDPETRITVIHEFAHRFVNPVLPRHLPALKRAGITLYDSQPEPMTKQAYGEWRITLNESFVRAAVIAWLWERDGEEPARERIVEETGNGFTWMDDLAPFLHERLQQRSRRGDFDALIPDLGHRLDREAERIARPSGPDLLVNGDFAQWADSCAVGWRLGVSACAESALRNARSKLERLDRGVALVADESSCVWTGVDQPLTLAPRHRCVLICESRALDLRCAPHQQPDSYVAVDLADSAGKRLVLMAIPIIRQPDWEERSVRFAVPSACASAKVSIVHTQGGRLEVRRMRLLDEGPITSKQCWEEIAAALGTEYPAFDARGKSWDELQRRHGPAISAATDNERFLAGFADLADDLDDREMLMFDPEHWSFTRSKTGHEGDPKVMAALLAASTEYKPLGFTGRTAEGFGYIATMQLSGDQRYREQMESAVADLKQGPGLIVDLRGHGMNGGWREGDFVAQFAYEPVVYAKVQLRNGPRPGDLTAPRACALEPSPGSGYDGPIVCLIGPGTVGYGEQLAMMFRALPNVTLMGEPSAGSPGPCTPVVKLANGCWLNYPRLLHRLPDGTIVEGRGMRPDIPIAPGSSPEVVLKTAVTELQRQITAGRAGQR